MKFNMTEDGFSEAVFFGTRYSEAARERNMPPKKFTPTDDITDGVMRF